MLLFLQYIGKGGSCFGISVAYILACWSAPRHLKIFNIMDREY